ncbi:MAG: hypothetical protein QGG40_03060, partial [Myxococcota bacterium]|nr:hypothetical protein [Myxococcota bacterium]
ACLFLSGLFWLLTSLSKNYIEVIQIPITYENLPENMLVVNELKAIHAEFDIRMIDQFLEEKGLEGLVTGQAIVVTSDGYVIGGEHRWAAVRQVDPTQSMNATKLQLDIARYVELGRQFNATR